MSYPTRFLTATAILCLTACGGGGGSGGGGSTPPPQPPVAETYTVTAVAIDLQRSADGQVLPVDGLPAQGATLTLE